MPEIIAITNQKGGVGKTTTAYNLAASLSQYNKKILLIDLDPQGNCSQAIGIDPSLTKKTMGAVLLGDVELKKAIKKTAISNVSLIPGNLTLAMVETKLLSKEGKAPVTMLRAFLHQKEVQIYDFIIIDCPPSLGFLSLNALTASDSLIIPIQCEYFALDALVQLLATITSVQRSTNPDLEIMGIVRTMYDPRTKLSIEVSQELQSNFKDKVFNAIIPRNISIPEAIAEGLPACMYKPLSAGSLAYKALSREVLEYAEKKQS